MRFLAGLLTALCIVSAPVGGLAEPRHTAFRTIIEAQLEAFRRDDAEAAFAHASPMIKGMFRTPERFLGMVMQGYPQVYRPRSVDFGAVITYRGQPTQLVYLTGPDGDAVIAYYQMQQQPDGTWRINGVYLEKAANA